MTNYDARSKQTALQEELLAEVPGAVYQYQYYPDGGSRFPFASRNIYLVYEVEPEDVIEDAQLVFDRIHPDDRGYVTASILRSRDTLRQWEADYRVRLPVRGERWLRGRATPSAQSDGSVVWNGYITDITDLKITEARLRDSESRYRSVVEAATDGIIITDEHGQVTACNDAAERILGRQRGEVLGRPVWDVQAEALQPGRADSARMQELKDAILDVLETDDVAVIGKGRPMPIARPDGARRVIHSSVFGFQVGGRMRSCSLIRDITEEQSVHHSLEYERSKLANIIDATGVGTWQWNVQTGEVDFNERWAEMVGYTISELEPLSIATWERLLHPEDADICQGALERHFSGEAPVYDVEVRVRHKLGHWVWIHDRGRVISRDAAGAPLMMFGTHLDITSRKQDAQERERLLQEKTIILGEVNHRIKNNLAMVASLIRLKDGEIGDRADLSDIQSRVMTLSALHEQFQYSGASDSVSMYRYLQSVAESACAGSSRPVRIINDTEELELPSRAATSLGLIINELATNAVKHGFHETEEAWISISGEPVGKRGFWLQVANSGVPLPAEVDFESPHTMGLRLITLLVQQIGATLSVTREPHPVFTIVVEA
ncbi:MAG: PAS domain-containing protein [Alkalispirochaeta sp.]